jgi:hypothetical protein
MASAVWPEAWAPKPNLSYSSVKTLKTCSYSWWLSYCAGEHEQLLSDELRRQRRLGPYSGLAGLVVDDIIKYAMRHFVEHGRWPDTLEGKGIELLRGYNAVSQEFRKTGRQEFGKPQPIDRLYFQDPISKEAVTQTRATIDQCLEVFWNSGIRDFLTNFPVEQWVVPKPVDAQPVPWYMLGEVPVYASFDLAIRPPGSAIIIDWKTGRRSPAADELVKRQLHLYAGFVICHWQVQAENVQLIPVWLSDTGALDAIPLDMGLLYDLRDELTQDYKDLVKRIRQVDRSPADAENIFPMTADEAVCRWCRFRACPGYARVQEGRSEPAEG